MTRSLSVTIVIAALPLLVSCSGMLDSNEPPERVYRLEPLKSRVSGSGPRPTLSIAVGAAPGLDTARILILESDARLNHYAGARWAENSPEVVGSLLRVSLETTGRYSRVVADSKSGSAEQILELELREFYARMGSPNAAPTVHAALHGYLSCDDTDNTISIESRAVIRDNRLGAVVAAFQQAVNDLSQQLVEQTATACPVPPAN